MSTLVSPLSSDHAGTSVLRSGNLRARLFDSLVRSILPRGLLPGLVTVLVALSGIASRADVFEYGMEGYITTVTVRVDHVQSWGWGSSYNTSYSHVYETHILGEYDSLVLIDDHYSNDGIVEGYYWWEEYDTYYSTWSVSYQWVGGGGDGGGGGGGGDEWEPVDPWADTDEYGVGSLGTFELKDRTEAADRVAAGAEWVGMAVGIFCEPVDWFMTAVEIYRDPTNPWSYIGLIPGVPSGLGRIAKKTISLATDVLRQLPGGKIIKIGTADAGMDHILRRHAHGTTGEPNAGKFNRGWHMTQIIDAIESAIQRSSPQPAGTGKVKFEAVLDDVIGLGYDPATGNMSPTRKILVIASETTGEIITAYPIPQ